MKKLIIKAITIVFILSIFQSNVTASSFKFIPTPNKDTIAPGEEIEIDLKLSNIDLGDEGMNTIEGMLEYDYNIFEEIKGSNFTSQNGWAFTYNNEDTELNGKFLGMLLDTGVKTETSIAKVKMKVKEGIKEQTTIIKIKDIKTNDGTEIVQETDKEITIKIEKKEEVPNDNKGNSTTTNKGNSTTNKVNGSVTGGNSSTTYKGGKLPQTGIQYIYISIAVAIMLGVGIVSFIKYKKIK